MDRENWERGIGQFMLAAGVIELRLLQLLWNISIPHQHDSEWIKLPLNRKLEKVKEVAKQSELSPQLEDKLKNVLGETKELVKTRNIIAHNPLSAQMAFEHEGMNPDLKLQVLTNSNVSFRYEDLLEAIRKAEQLDGKLLELICDDGLWDWSLRKEES